MMKKEFNQTKFRKFGKDLIDKKLIEMYTCVTSVSTLSYIF